MPTLTITNSSPVVSEVVYYGLPTGTNNTQANYNPGGATGGDTNAVLLQGDQSYIHGVKTWRNNNIFDASIFISYDISVGGHIIERDSWLVREASLGNTLYWTIDGSLEASLGTTINELNDIGDVSVGGPVVDQVLTWKGTYWEAEDASAGSSTLEGLTDVSIGDVSMYDALMYDVSISEWENVRTIDIKENFYTKSEVDDLLDAIDGGGF